MDSPALTTRWYSSLSDPVVVGIEKAAVDPAAAGLLMAAAGAAKGATFVRSASRVFPIYRWGKGFKNYTRERVNPRFWHPTVAELMIDAHVGRKADAFRKTPVGRMLRRWAGVEKRGSDPFLDEVQKIATAPVAKQTSKHSCGSAALLTVLHRYGLGPEEEKDVREAAKTKLSGTDPQGILSGAKAFGLEGEVRQKCTPKDLVDAHKAGWSIILAVQAPEGEPKAWERIWKQGHYVVISGVSAKGPTILDPSRGVPSERAWSWDGLVQRWHDYWFETSGGKRKRRIADRLAIFLRPATTKTAAVRDPFLEELQKIATKRSALATCLDKVQHATEADAQQAALRSSARSGKNITVYKCPVCKKYHLTSKGKTKTAAAQDGGHWRKLEPVEVGHDPAGNKTPGKTWVRQNRLLPSVQLKPHQLAYEKAVVSQPGTLALHGTGTGKTLSAIAAFEKLKGEGKASRALVVTPAGLRQNFLAKGINKFTTSRGVVLEHPSQVDNKTEYVIVSYEAFRQNPDGWIDTVKPDAIIADEVHRAQNPDSKTYDAMMTGRRRVPRFMGLTASAVQNEPADIVPLLQLATGGEHPIQTKQEFRRAFMKSEPSPARSIFGRRMRRKKVINVSRLREIVGPSVHYIEDLDATEKPAKDVETVPVQMSTEQTKLYNMSMKGIDPKIVDKIRRGEAVNQKEAMNLFTRLLRARQVSLSVGSVTEMPLLQAAEQTPKMKKILDDASDHLRRTPDGQIIIYSNLFKGSVDVLATGLKARKIPFGIFAGRGQEGMTEEVRQKAVEDYLVGKNKVILITGAGAEGLSLGNTTMVQLADGHYNPERISQAEARGVRAGGLAHRAPKDRRVAVKRYVSTLPKTFWQTITFQSPFKGVDEFVYLTAKRKEDMNRQLRDALSGASKEHEHRRDSWLYRNLGVG